MASEMLYPILPLYLKEIGFSVAAIGLLEGFAEALAGLSKGFFGTWSDNSGKRMPFVRWGYSLSAISKPMMALSSLLPWIFFARMLDRTGKGLRTGARDAVLTAESTPATRARVFGFHRSLDTAGAMIGPAIALLYLYCYPNQYRDLFLVAFLPGIAAVILSLIIKEQKTKHVASRKYPSFKAFYQYWISSPRAYKKLTGALLLFALFNSSDVLLLLRMKETGINDRYLVGVYIFYNAVYAAFAYPAGVLADRIGLKKIFTGGLFLFVIVYAGMAHGGDIYLYACLFLLYGIYAAATEGVSKAWISSLVAKENIAAATGTLSGFQSIASLVASALAGFLWLYAGAVVTFLSSALVTLLVIIYIHNKTE